MASRDHGSVGYRVPKEWAALPEEQRGVGSVTALRRQSKAGFLAGYRGFVCRTRGCAVCAGIGVGLPRSVDRTGGSP